MLFKKKRPCLWKKYHYYALSSDSDIQLHVSTETF